MTQLSANTIGPRKHEFVTVNDHITATFKITNVHKTTKTLFLRVVDAETREKHKAYLVSHRENEFIVPPGETRRVTIKVPFLGKTDMNLHVCSMEIVGSWMAGSCSVVEAKHLTLNSLN